MGTLHKPRWKDTTYSEYKKHDVEIVYEELTELGNKLGKSYKEVGNQEYVDYAREEVSSESHKMFEWNDFKAAENYRRGQAGDIINSIVDITVVVNEETQEKKIIQTPLFIDPGSRKCKGYAPVDVVMSNVDLRQAALHKAYNQLLAIKEKYNNLSELASVFKAIDDLKIE